MARKAAIALTLILAAASALSACGRKGPLESPSEARKAAEPTPTPTPAPTAP